MIVLIGVEIRRDGRKWGFWKKSEGWQRGPVFSCRHLTWPVRLATDPWKFQIRCLTLASLCPTFEVGTCAAPSSFRSLPPSFFPRWTLDEPSMSPRGTLSALPWPRTGRRRGAARGLAPRSTIRWPCHVGFSMHYRSERPDLIKACVINYNNYSAILDWNRSETLKRKALKKPENAMKIPESLPHPCLIVQNRCLTLELIVAWPVRLACRGVQTRVGRKSEKDRKRTVKWQEKTEKGRHRGQSRSWPRAGRYARGRSALPKSPKRRVDQRWLAYPCPTLAWPLPHHCLTLASGKVQHRRERPRRNSRLGGPASARSQKKDQKWQKKTEKRKRTDGHGKGPVLCRELHGWGHE